MKINRRNPMRGDFVDMTVRLSAEIHTRQKETRDVLSLMCCGSPTVRRLCESLTSFCKPRNCCWYPWTVLSMLWSFWSIAFNLSPDTKLRTISWWRPSDNTESFTTSSYTPSNTWAMFCSRSWRSANWDSCDTIVDAFVSSGAACAFWGGDLVGSSLVVDDVVERMNLKTSKESAVSAEAAEMPKE